MLDYQLTQKKGYGTIIMEWQNQLNPIDLGQYCIKKKLVVE